MSLDEALRADALIVRSKLVVPPLAERLVARPRLNQLIARLIDNHRLVWITATAGAGKTTAVVQAAGELERPVVWLSLEKTDAAPGRLLVYLEAAIARQVPSVQGLVGNVLAARVPHAEAAALLSESVAGIPLTLVLDGLENLVSSDEALAIVSALIRYAPPDMKTVLLSRVDAAFDLGSAAGPDQVAALGEADLAFTREEAAEALAQAGMGHVNPAKAVEATGGWVTGVLFEAWRSRQHVAGTGGEVDPLHGYLASQILDRLEPSEREFLVLTSLLDEVTADRATAMGVTGAGQLLVSLRAKHLPVSWISGTYTMRCHPRFREYLLTLLERQDREQVRSLRRAYGGLLGAEGHLEEAVEQFLAAGAPEQALLAAEAVIGKVIERLDLTVAERWLRELAPSTAKDRSRLAVAELMLAIAGEDYVRGCSIGDRLEADGQRTELARSSPTGASIMAWCYWHLNRVEDMRAVMQEAPSSPEMEAVRYLASLVDTSGGNVPAPALTGGPLDALIMRVDYAHGRFREPTQTEPSPWAATVSAPWRAGRLRATGHLAEALELYRTADGGGSSPAWMRGVVGPELMIDLHDDEEARRTIAGGRELIKTSGSLVFQWLSWVIEAKLNLRVNNDAETAFALLDRAEAAGGRSYAFIAEAMDTWRGMALLLSGRDNDQAVQVLRRAVASMQQAGRDVDLPAAAVYLSEAEWRRGDQRASDAAADEAFAAAVRQGSNHQLLLALADFQAVVARRLDAESGTDSPWHELGSALLARDIHLENVSRTAVSLAEFGRITITAANVEVKPRIAKSNVLLAYLATRPGHSAGRDELLTALFDGSIDDSSRAYLRQATHRLREALPEGAGPYLAANEVALAPTVRLTSESVTFEALLAQAARLSRGDKLRTLLSALAISDQGEYLPGVDTAWAVQRRAHLEDQAAQARLQAAQLAFNSELFREAADLAEAVVVRDPFRESAWRLLMRIANAVGDEDRVIASFRRCTAAFDELGVKPSDATRELFDRLRR